MKKIYFFLAIALGACVLCDNSVKSMLIMCLALFVAILWGMCKIDSKK